MAKTFMSMDGNTACSTVAYMFTEVAAIYPITPSSPMAEVVDQWSTQGRKNIFGTQVKVAELQAEGGAAGAVHGALQGGALATTFTASQGLLLMIPNIYKMAGEFLPGVLHVSARSLAKRSLNIFGDHEDVYACRQTGACMLASHSVQEAMDLAGVAHLSAIEGSVPFIHFFDGFRTSHEVQKIEVMDQDFMASLLDRDAVARFKANAMNPHTNPVTRGGNENDDIFFQGVEAQNEHYNKVPDIVAKYMKAVSEYTGREYAPFTYYGAKDAERIIIAMGSVTETIRETVDDLNSKGEKVGLIKVHLYRPFSTKYLTAVLPATAKKIAVLDRTKEMGAREPLYLDVVNALKDRNLTITGGRYGLGSHDTQPKHIKAVYDELAKDNPKEEFTIGITDDVTNLSLACDDSYILNYDYTSCLFYGLGSDGTVSANKSSIKIIGDETNLYAQGYYAYDSKKAGGVTRSHLRFGPSPIRSTYYIDKADFVSCSLDSYCFKFDMVRNLKKGGTFLLNTTIPANEVEKHLPNRMLKGLAEKQANFYVINATQIAKEVGMGRRTNTILQSAFFALNTQIMPLDESLKHMKHMAEKSYMKKGKEIVELNFKAIDAGKDGFVKVDVKPEWANLTVNANAKTGDEYFDEHLTEINNLNGYDLPTSHFTKYGILDGTIHNEVSFREKRNIATMVPSWDASTCIQCGSCVMVCPHATVRAFLLSEDEIKNSPAELEVLEPSNALAKAKADGLKYRIQVSPMNCVGCGLCATECKGVNKETGKKALEMVPNTEEAAQAEEVKADYLYKKVEYRDGYFNTDMPMGMQFVKPYFEVSGSCPGCGETPYYRLASQLFGKDMMIANATGCSMIYCSAVPSTPFVVDENGEGPSWANSLFEDNAEYGYGMALARNFAEAKILGIMEANKDGDCKEAFEKYIAAGNNRDAQRACKDEVIKAVKASSNPAVKELLDYERDLVSKSVWIVGGDGWAYDIGYGGLDHVLANDVNVNVLVLDTEMYSNTGGQASKSTQSASIAKFAAGGKATAKKDLGAISMAYGHIYTASVSMGANPAQTIKAFKEAESYDGPSIIIAYAPCDQHGIKGGLANHQKVQKAAVECGYTTLYRYDPRKPQPLTVDSKEPNWDNFEAFLLNENRFKQLVALKGEEAAKAAFAKTKADAQKRYERLKALEASQK
ncbi:MAG: pyruvate:ferredoxin (flavodoxin) oxidoreductase [Erysipelotrichaceae bacterium]|nr:pyruvate:ferredoxin (flavodoxin) oxidoreductase [Erysipelotrichaceae bacterium]